jgi:hypothetical protein
MDWKECLGKRISKGVGRDESLIRSLLRSSANRQKSEAALPMSAVTADSKVSLAYDSLRELLEALALSSGYKIYNHECYAAFLKEVAGRSDLGDDFDRLRMLRNSINYYGREVSPAEASDAIALARKCIKTVLPLMKPYSAADFEALAGKAAAAARKSGLREKDVEGIVQRHRNRKA